MKKTGLAVALTSAAIFFILLLVVVVVGTPGIDNSVSSWSTKVFGSVTGGFFFLLSTHMSYILVALAGILILTFYFFGDRKKSIILAGSLFLGVLIDSTVKFIVQRQRPLSQISYDSGYSFPSNHTVFATILFSMMIYFFAGKIENRFLKWIFIVGNSLLILLVGFSRIFLNVHWFTDVIGGVVLGILVVSISSIYLR